MIFALQTLHQLRCSAQGVAKVLLAPASYLNVIRLPGESLVGCPLLLEGVLGGVGEYGGRNKTSAPHLVNHFNNAICMVYRSIIQYNNAVRVHTIERHEIWQEGTLQNIIK